MSPTLATRSSIFLPLAIAGCAADLATKSWIFDRLGVPSGRTEWIVGHFFGFQTSLNRGALFGLGQGQVWLFATLSVLAAVGILYWVFVFGEANRPLLVALGCIMGGVLGNLYDRLGLHGLTELSPEGVWQPVYAVRDWLLFQYGDWTWPNFNIADSLLVVGIGMMLLHAWLMPEKSTAGKVAATAK